MMAAGLLCGFHVFVCPSLLLTSLENVFFIYTFQFTPLKKRIPDHPEGQKWKSCDV